MMAIYYFPVVAIPLSMYVVPSIDASRDDSTLTTAGVVNENF